MGRPQSQKKGSNSHKGATRGVSKKTIAKKRAKPQTKPSNQGASKKTTTKRAKPQTKQSNQGASKKSTTKRTKPQTKPSNQGASKKSTTKRTKPQTKPSNQGVSNKTTKRAKPSNQGASLKKTIASIQRARPQAQPNIQVVTSAPVPPPPVNIVVLERPSNALANKVYREEGPAPKRPRVTPPTPYVPSCRPGHEQAYDAYKEDSPTPKPLKAVRAGTPSYDELEKLANEIPEHWKQIGRRLGIQEAKLVAFEGENKKFSEQAFQMLKHWKESKARDATYQLLFEALSDSETVSRSDLAEKYCC